MTSPVRNRSCLQRWALGTLFAALSTAAAAAPVAYGNITLDASYTLDGGSTVDGMASGGVSATPGGADLLWSDATATGSSVFFHTYGFTGAPTYFGARASGEGVFTAITSAHYGESFTNTSGSAQNYLFSFVVAPGELDLFGAGTGAADLLLQVTLNGVTIARDFTSVLYNNGSTTCTSDDLGSLGSYMNCGSASSVGGLYTVNLGVIDAGDTFALGYDIVTTLTGDFTTSTDCGVPIPNFATFAVAIEGDALDGGGSSSCGGAVARSGDPFDPFAYAANFSVTASSVPEPGSLALLGLGFAGLVAARRRNAAR